MIATTTTTTTPALTPAQADAVRRTEEMQRKFEAVHGRRASLGELLRFAIERRIAF